MKRRKVLLWLGGGLLALAVTCYAAIPRLLPWVLERIRPDIVFRGDSRGKVLYLTIDDAPTLATGEILRVLEKHRVPAAFFVISGRIRSIDDLRKISQAGHLLGNHLRTTHACANLSWEEFQADFGDADRAIGQFQHGHFFRPSSGLCTKRQSAYASNRGYTTILGTMFPFDTLVRNQAVLRFLLEWLAVPGGILIMHDGNPRAATTAAVLDQVIPDLRRRGFEFRSLDELDPPKQSK